MKNLGQMFITHLTKFLGAHGFANMLIIRLCPESKMSVLS